MRGTPSNQVRVLSIRRRSVATATAVTGACCLFALYCRRPHVTLLPCVVLCHRVAPPTMSARRKPWLSVAQLLAQAKRPVSKLLPTSRVSQRGLKINPWSVVKALDQPWRRIDHMASKYEADMHHRLLDGVVGWAKGKSIFFPFGFFPDGFGDPSVPVSFATALQAWTSRRARGEPVEALDVRTVLARTPSPRNCTGRH